MDHASLHRIPEFKPLALNAGFVALLEYLRTVRPRATSKEAHGMIQDSGKLEAYLELLDIIEAAFLPPKENKEATQFHPYTNIPTNLPLSQENQ